MDRLFRVCRSVIWILSVATILTATAQPALAQPCVVPDNGAGTVDLPPQGCGYVSPSDLHEMINGLPPGTKVRVGVEHSDFFQVTRTPGGTLGGERESFQSILRLNLNGSEMPGGYQRLLTMQVLSTVDTAPRTPGAPVQSFDTDMFRLQGQLPIGDPDFDLLRITAGTSFGMPSPGHTTLTQQAGSWAVDSFFDINYRIDFVGHSPGPFGGMSGSTTGTIRMQTGLCPPVLPGIDQFPSTAKLVVQRCDPNLIGCAPIGDPLVLRTSDGFTTPTIVQRGPHDPSGGTIPIQLMQMDLQGNHPLVGPFSVHVAGPASPSNGVIENVTQNSATCQLDSGDTTLRVCATMTVGPETWTNVDPLTGICDPLELRGHITTLPPTDAKFETPFVKYVTLYDQATSQPRARACYVVHHADPPFPPPGTDCFPTTTLSTIVDFFNPPFSGPLTAQGPSRVRRDPLSGTGTVPLELVQMSLTGNAGPLGNVQLSVSPLPTPPSGGQVQSQPPPGSYLADGFFDVFFNVQTNLPPPNNQLHSQTPTHVTATVDNLPPTPGTSFVSQPGIQTQLLNTSNQVVGRIRDVVHTIGPPQDWTPPPPKDDYCFDSIVIYKLKVFATGCEETLTIPGNFRILRGSATDTNGDGRVDRARSLMVWKLLAGHSQCLAVDITGRLVSTAASLGQIDALAPDEFFPSNSFFDVFSEIKTPTTTLTPSVPIRMTTTINNLPPDNGEIYFGPGSVIPITDGGGLVVGEISDIRHIIRQRILPCGFDCLPHLTWLSKTSVRAANGGGGATFDTVRGSSLGLLRSTGGSSMGVVACLQNNGSGTSTDAGSPTLGNGFVYFSRDGFDDFVGTYNTNHPKQLANYNTLAGTFCAP